MSGSLRDAALPTAEKADKVPSNVGLAPWWGDRPWACCQGRWQRMRAVPGTLRSGGWAGDPPWRGWLWRASPASLLPAAGHQLCGKRGHEEGGTRASPGPPSHGGGRLARNRQWRETEFPRGHPSSRVKITFCYTSNTSVEQNRPLLLPLAHLLYGNHSRVVASECPVPWGNQCRRDLQPWAHSAVPCLSRSRAAGAWLSNRHVIAAADGSDSSTWPSRLEPSLDDSMLLRAAPSVRRPGLHGG